MRHFTAENASELQSTFQGVCHYQSEVPDEMDLPMCGHDLIESTRGILRIIGKPSTLEGLVIPCSGPFWNESWCFCYNIN
jgi:hypothetical protein